MVSAMLCMALLLSPEKAYAMEAFGAVSASEEATTAQEQVAQKEVQAQEQASWMEVQAEARAALQELLAEREVMALVYLADTQALLAEPSFAGEEVEQLPTGQTVYIRDVLVDEDYIQWVYVETYYQGKSLKGYIPRFYLACSDEAFLDWEATYVPESSYEKVVYMDASGKSADIEQFPDSYKDALYALKQAHPNWVFVRMDTGLDWNTVVYNQMQNNRSLIYKSYPEYMRGDCYDDGNWYYPTEETLEYYMDPRNGLSESAVFQFELLTYNGTYHTQEAVESFLSNTFMNSRQNAPGTSMTYSRIFWAIGAEQNVSPFHLASRVYQEQGAGNSSLISGTYPGFEGYYNYFNVRASGTSHKEIVENGLAYAKSQNWNNAYFSILGGSKLLASGYISKGQDTVYLQKYNVNRDGYYALYSHQYMQNIVAPTSEGSTIRNMYARVGALDNTFVFKVPVYLNMPEEACAKPTEKPQSTPAPLPEPLVPQPEKIEKFVERMYTVALEREAESSGLQYWTDGLMNGTTDGASVAQGFLMSGEFAAKNHNNSQYVEALYKIFFDRVAVEEEINYWVGVLEAGNSREVVLAGFVNSGEFGTLCSECGIYRGYLSRNGTAIQPIVGRFAERFYTVALGREAEVDGLGYWVSALLSGEADGASVSRGFLLSGEFIDKNYNNRNYVRVLYGTFFNRVPGDEELDYWAGELEAGKSRENVLAGFVNSNEFGLLCGEYGISRGVLRGDGKAVSPGIGRFAERLYTRVLERAGDVAGIEYWTLQIADGACTPEAAAQSFFRSPEYLAKNTDDEKYISALYLTFMDREADSDGLRYWKEMIVNGKSREEVLAGFAQSDEFKEIMRRYGL